jgi:spermidine/putrescine-binding protein
MKKIAYLLVIVIASASMASCGGSSASCADSDKYIIKNMKFENQEMVLSKKFKADDEIIN